MYMYSTCIILLYYIIKYVCTHCLNLSQPCKLVTVPLSMWMCNNVTFQLCNKNIPSTYIGVHDYMYNYIVSFSSQAGAIARQALSKPIKALSRPTRSQTGPRLEFYSPSTSSTNQQSRSRSPSPRPVKKSTDLSPLDEDLFAEPTLADRGEGLSCAMDAGYM